MLLPETSLFYVPEDKDPIFPESIPWPCPPPFSGKLGEETEKMTRRIRETSLSSGRRQRVSIPPLFSMKGCRGPGSQSSLGGRAWPAPDLALPAALHLLPRVSLLTPFLFWPCTEGESQEPEEASGASLGKRIGEQCCLGPTKPRVGRLLTGSHMNQRR